MPASAQWIRAIEEACAEPDPSHSNERITDLHYRLSKALIAALGHEAGPNFHSWAVWGSRKAGVTIRQEDLDSAVHNAAITAGVVGSTIGAATGIFFFRHWLLWLPEYVAAALGALTGALSGVWTGQQLAIWSRRKAAALVLKGNQIVLQEIGEQSARFLDIFEDGVSSTSQAAFFAGLLPGTTEERGQDRLANAFRSYLDAFAASDPDVKRDAMIAGNCEIVYHEHIRLEPYIRGAMPWIVRRCATQRMMTYEVGETLLTVGTNVPGVPSLTAATNWTKIEERMRYVFALFRKFHNAPEVLAPPHSENR